MNKITEPRVNKQINTLKNILRTNNEKKINWLYVSGTGEHITNNLNLLKNYKEEYIRLKCANNMYCDFEGYGEN